MIAPTARLSAHNPDMRFELIIRADSKPKGTVMPNWIDNMKSRESSLENDKRRGEEIRLQNAKIVGAKAPSFWATVMEIVKANSEQLRAAYRDDAGRQCDLTQSGNGHILQGRKVPITMLYMTLNTAASCVEMMHSSRRERYDIPVPSPLDGMRIVVGPDDEVEFVWRGRRFYDPAALAEALIRSVCGIKD